LFWVLLPPLAEGILASKLRKTNKVDSAGTGSGIDHKPDERSIAVAKK
jgi:protein-tyrosine-phosphatase